MNGDSRTSTSAEHRTMPADLQIQVCLIVVAVACVALLWAFTVFSNSILLCVVSITMALIVMSVLLASFRGSPLGLACLWIGLILIVSVLAVGALMLLLLGGTMPALFCLGAGSLVQLVAGRVNAWATRLVAQLRSMPFCLKCDYDLRGSIEAGRMECPECGESMREEQINAHAAATKAHAGEPS